MFYVYEWYVKNTNEIFYVGKGCGNRYKQTNKRNKLFKLYYEKFNCDSRIIKEFENENDAFIYEHERILELKNIDQAKCNLDYGGKGGTHFCWTDEMKKYKSEYNPMKAFAQRQRMKTNNPMKNKETIKKVSAKTRKAIILNGIKYNGVLLASRETGHTSSSIIKWCKQGYDTNGNPCRYANEQQKEIPLIKKIHPKAATPKAILIDGIRFETILDGAKYIKGNSSNLIRAIKAKRKYKNHVCEYDNQQPSHTNTNNSSMEGSTTNE